MKFYSVLSLLLLNLALAHNGGGDKYCGTTTITKTATHTDISKAPAVTKTFTQNKALCFTTETITDTQTVHSKTTVVDTITSTPIVTKTKWAEPYTTTKTHTQTVTTCSASDSHHKRSYPIDARAFGGFLENADDDEDIEGLSNAERIRRGLPLAKPGKRHDGAGAHPSCVPSTSIAWTEATVTKTVTPTSWTTTKACKFTQTLDIKKYTTVTVVKTKTNEVTVTGAASTSKVTLTPTSTLINTHTVTSTTGACKPTDQ